MLPQRLHGRAGRPLGREHRLGSTACPRLPRSRRQGRSSPCAMRARDARDLSLRPGCGTARCGPVTNAERRIGFAHAISERRRDFPQRAPDFQAAVRRGVCEVMAVERRPYRSSRISSRSWRAAASRGSRPQSSRIRGPSARNHRRSHIRGRDPGPPRSQCSPHRTHRRKHATAPRQPEPEGLTTRHRRCQKSIGQKGSHPGGIIP